MEVLPGTLDSYIFVLELVDKCLNVYTSFWYNISSLHFLYNYLKYKVSLLMHFLNFVTIVIINDHMLIVLVYCRFLMSP